MKDDEAGKAGVTEVVKYSGKGTVKKWKREGKGTEESKG